MDLQPNPWPLPKHITPDELYVRLRSRVQYVTRRDTLPPIALHAWPKGEHADPGQWFGIGPCPWGGTTESWWDIRLTSDDDYLAVNYELMLTCYNLGIPYINMR